MWIVFQRPCCASMGVAAAVQATKRRFTLIFRTFGTDVDDVIEEVNMFATGAHPSYPGVFMDGRDGVTDIRLSRPGSTGAYFRCGRRRNLLPCMCCAACAVLPVTVTVVRQARGNTRCLHLIPVSGCRACVIPGSMRVCHSGTYACG